MLSDSPDFLRYSYQASCDLQLSLRPPSLSSRSRTGKFDSTLPFEAIRAVLPRIAAAGADANRSAGRTIFPLSNEAEIEERQEQNSIEDGAEPGEFRRLDKAGAEDRHRNAIKPQVEENA